uniref:THAP4-like heme-binding domain-containing protein n=1 Tax=Hanusia phi TaxID=3032 RepID=A0A7S0EMH2_9CRYP|eukprot:768399-Hanusia_phi.AAC.13
MADNNLNPKLTPLKWILGSWKGDGEGGYPGSKEKDPLHFLYTEILTFNAPNPAKPVISYDQKTVSRDGSKKMHAECGFYRVTGDNGQIEASIAQSTGIAEVQKGSMQDDGKTLLLESTVVANAEKVKAIHRSLKYDAANDQLVILTSMEASGHPMTQHLSTVLKRVA